jgi:hypothetical protein
MSGDEKHHLASKGGEPDRLESDVEIIPPDGPHRAWRRGTSGIWVSVNTPRDGNFAYIQKPRLFVVVILALMVLVIALAGILIFVVSTLLILIPALGVLFAALFLAGVTRGYFRRLRSHRR